MSLPVPVPVSVRFFRKPLQVASGAKKLVTFAGSLLSLSRRYAVEVPVFWGWFGKPNRNRPIGELAKGDVEFG